MPNTTVRITLRGHRLLKELASQTGQSMQAVLEEALDNYRRQRFFEQGNADYARLRGDPHKWAEFQRELREWDVTLGDGIEP